MGLIEVGAKAPAFSLPDQDGRKHTLAEYKGRDVILYFYPKDDTSVCTDEACAFRDALPAFEKTKAVVLGVSPDSVKSHTKFAAKFDLTFPLLADEPAEGEAPAVCDAYGVWQEKSMYGRKYMGVVRTTYLIGGDGKVKARWDKVKVKGHVEAVMGVLGGDAGEVKAGKKTAVTKGSKKTVAKKVGKTPSKKADAKKKAGKSSG